MNAPRVGDTIRTTCGYVHKLLSRPAELPGSWITRRIYRGEGCGGPEGPVSGGGPLSDVTVQASVVLTEPEAEWAQYRIHVLHGGVTYCGQPGFPRDWPPGHYWVHRHEARRATCSSCCKKLLEAKE